MHTTTFNGFLSTGLSIAAVVFWALVPSTNAAHHRHTPRQTYPTAACLKMNKLILFGDSWTDTSFELAGPQPSLEQPLGNPSVPGNTFNLGKWPVYLTTKYNTTCIETYNFARSGSTVNASIIANEAVGSPDLVTQVQGDFLPHYGATHASSWQPNTTIFGIFIGIDDVNIALQLRNRTTEATLNEVFTSYRNLVGELYQNGARHFLLLNMPPMDRAPKGVSTLRPVITDWNRHLCNLGTDLTRAHADASVANFDTHTFLNKVINNVTTFPETACIVNTTGYCPAYSSMSENLDFSDPSCNVPLTEYLWVNTLHITSSVHQAMASQIIKTIHW